MVYAMWTFGKETNASIVLDFAYPLEANANCLPSNKAEPEYDCLLCMKVSLSLEKGFLPFPEVEVRGKKTESKSLWQP